MNKVKFYQFLAIGLFLTNIVLLTFLFLGKNQKHKSYNGPRDIIIERLGLNAQQAELYDQMIGRHRSDIAKYMKEIKLVKSRIYAQLAEEPPNQMVTDSLHNRLNNLESQISKTHFAHFLDIKSLCTPEQLPAYQKLTMQMEQLFAPKGAPKPKIHK